VRQTLVFCSSSSRFSSFGDSPSIWRNLLGKIPSASCTIRTESQNDQDMDVLVLKPFHYLRQYDFSLGEEGVNASVVCCCCCCCAIYHNPYPWLAFAQGLGNAVLIARKGAPFLKRWRAEYCRHFDSSHWNHYSVRRANCDVFFFSRHLSR